jgi:hypothetical protein
MLSCTYARIALVLAVLGLAGQGLVSPGRAADGGVVVRSPVLTRTELRPSIVQADATVTRGGAPVLPTGVTCTASFAGDKAYGVRRYEGRFVRGLVRCNFAFNNARYRGKTLVGEVTVFTGSVGSSGGGRFTKRFSVRIGSGNTLEKPLGATVKNEGGDKAKPSATTEWHGMVRVVKTTGTPGQSRQFISVDLRLSLLPGAVETAPLGRTQGASWVATYSEAIYDDPPCLDPAGNPVPSTVGKRTNVRGRTGDPVGNYGKDSTRVAVSWDAARSTWVISLKLPALPLPVKTTRNCGKTWISTVSGDTSVQNLTIRAPGTAESTALQGRGTPTGFYNASDTSVTWDLRFAQSR